jgi:hypothetical protein
LRSRPGGEVDDTIYISGRLSHDEGGSMVAPAPLDEMRRIRDHSNLEAQKERRARWCRVGSPISGGYARLPEGALSCGCAVIQEHRASCDACRRGSELSLQEQGWIAHSLFPLDQRRPADRRGFRLRTAWASTSGATGQTATAS